MHRLLAGGIDAEVNARDDHIALPETRRKPRRYLFKRMLRCIVRIFARHIFGRTMQIGVDYAAE